MRSTKTFILWDGKPWCREHFLAATERAERERATEPRDSGVPDLGAAR